ncbi:MAG: helix-turn-helix transcriptional regulator [Patescibacteria group bacterium]|jgi:DNA-binding XRE family transcriptional regulator
MANKVKLIPFSQIEKEWMKNPKFRRIRKEREPQFRLVKQLISARIKQKKTQEQVARKAGLKQEQVSALESLRVNARIDTFCKVAGALKIKSLKLS